MFILSPDQEFPGDGTGTISSISYDSVFRTIKKFFVIQWTHRRVQAIVQQINAYVFTGTETPTGPQVTASTEELTDSLDRIMTAMDDSDSDDDLYADTPIATQAATVPVIPDTSTLSPTPVVSTTLNVLPPSISHPATAITSIGPSSGAAGVATGSMRAAGTSDVVQGGCSDGLTIIKDSDSDAALATKMKAGRKGQKKPKDVSGNAVRRRSSRNVTT